MQTSQSFLYYARNRWEYNLILSTKLGGEVLSQRLLVKIINQSLSHSCNEKNSNFVMHD